MELQFNGKSVFGKSLFYPNCQASKAIAQAFGVKTLTNAQLDTLSNGGFKVVVTPTL